jgi:hypothetical protein
MGPLSKAVALALVTGGLAGAGASSASGYFIDHASVRGIGTVGTTLPSDTQVHPPGYIPPAYHATEAEYEEQRQREIRMATHTHPGPDSGPPETIRKVKHDFARELFLSKVALTCRPFPEAGRWVYWWVFLPPGRLPYSSRYEENRVNSEHEHGCLPFRLKIGSWKTVRIDQSGKRARLQAIGQYQNDRGANGTWDRNYRMRWKAAVKLKSGRWRITVISEQSRDPTGSG